MASTEDSNFPLPMRQSLLKDDFSSSEAVDPVTEWYSHQNRILRRKELQSPWSTVNTCGWWRDWLTKEVIATIVVGIFLTIVLNDAKNTLSDANDTERRLQAASLTAQNVLNQLTNQKIQELHSSVQEAEQTLAQLKSFPTLMQLQQNISKINNLWTSLVWVHNYQQTASEGGHVTVRCPTGYRVVSGDCQSLNGYESLEQAHRSTDSEWWCTWRDDLNQKTAGALCARIPEYPGHFVGKP